MGHGPTADRRGGTRRRSLARHGCPRPVRGDERRPDDGGCRRDRREGAGLRGQQCRARAGAIGLVVAFSELDRLSGTFFTAVLKGAAKGLSTGDVQLVLLPADHPDGELVPRLLRSRAVDGAIVILQHEITHLVEALATSPVPIAWVGRPRIALDPGTIVVDSDNYGGGVLAAQALLGAGRRRLGIITGPSDMEPARARARGWNDELVRNGIVPLPTVHGDFTLDGGAAAMARLLRRAPDIDGVFASSDLMAVGAMRVLQASGRQVPADISVVGFDDVLIAMTCDPPLLSLIHI